MRENYFYDDLFKFFKEGMFFPVLFVFDKGVELDVVNALENVVFYVGIFLLERRDQLLHLPPCGKGVLVPAR